MAIQFVNNVDFNANQAQSIRIENVATDPSTELVIGRIIFNTAADTLKQYVANDGSGNPGWVEVGSTTVKAGTGIGVTFASGEATVRNTGLVSVLDGTFIDLTKQGGGDNTELTADLSAAGTPDATKYLRGDNSWEPISGIYDWTIAGDTGSETIVNGDTVNFTGGTYITTAYATSTNELSITHDATSRSDTTSSDSPGYGGTFQAVTSVSTNSTGHVTAIDVSTVTIPSAENYSFNVAGDTGTPETIGSGNTLDIAGGTNINTVVGATDTVTVNLDDSITLAGTLSVTGTTTLGAVDILGNVDMNSGKINNLGNGTASSDAVNLGQLQSAVAGVGLFKGGYNASTNSPAIAGSSNIALDQGDFYVVTTDGTITFSDTTVDVEVGDLIFANGSISANSNPASTAYTIVIQDQNIAGEGATDGATEKGVAGFNSAHFSVTANGWVSADVATASSIGIGNVDASTATALDGLSVTYSSGTATVGLDVDGLTAVTTTPDTSDTIVIYDTSASTNKKATLADIATAIDISKGVRISLSSTVSGVGRTEAGGLTTFDVNTGTVLSQSTAKDVKAEIITSGGQTVYADVTRSGSILNVIFTGSVANGTYEALLVDVG